MFTSPDVSYCAASSPSGSLLRYPQTVQVGLLPAAAALLRRVDVVWEEGPRGVAVGGLSLAVGLRIPLIGQLVGVFKGAILMSGCRHTEKFVPAADVKNNLLESCDPGERYLEVQAPTEMGCSGAFSRH